MQLYKKNKTMEVIYQLHKKGDFYMWDPFPRSIHAE